VRASKAIVAWAFEDQLISGFEEVIQVTGVGERRYSKYVGSAAMQEASRWYVICDFLLQGVVLSDNPRIERISREEALAILDQAATIDEGSFLFVFPSNRSGRMSVSRNEVRLMVVTRYAAFGGNTYEFAFTSVDGQLSATRGSSGGP
jgi:hypothetical protein